MTFVSLRGRVLLNAEAMNMTESVGNYVKHRRIPVTLPKTGTTYFVPAISGESIAHGFQSALAEEAKKNKKPVCKLCDRKIFLKSTTLEIMRSAFSLKEGSSPLDISDEDWNKMTEIRKKKEKEREEKEKKELEKFEVSLPFVLERYIIKNCIVEDVGGFLYAEQTLEGFNIGGVKRTSNFYTGYMIPGREAIENTVIEPQLHSRYALGTPFVRERGQMIYYVELSSAPYTFSFDLDTRYIGKTTFFYEKAGEEVVEDRKERVVITLNSLQKFLTELMFGAKKTRYLPIIDWESLCLAVSKDPWTVPSSFSANYVVNTLNKLEKIDGKTKLFVYINPEVFEDTTAYVKKKTEELLENFYRALEEFKEKLKERGDEKLINWEEFKKKKLEKLLEKKVDELTETSDLKYASAIQQKYVKAREELEKKGYEVYESFEDCVNDAINASKSLEQGS
jgi:CRISPR-associated protein Csa2